MPEASVVVRVKEGLHARPATRFVKLAKSFPCEIEISVRQKTASAKSSVKVMLLAVKENDHILLRTTGDREDEALAQLVSYLENPLAGLDSDEPDLASKGAASATAATLTSTGLGASDGIGIGPAFPYFADTLKPDKRLRKGEEIAVEQSIASSAFRKVIATMRQQITIAGQDGENRGIIAAMAELADDDTLRAAVASEVADGRAAHEAILLVARSQAAEFEKLEDPYQRARADDITAIGRMLAFAAAGLEEPDLSTLPAGSILLANDIGAFELAKAPLKKIAGIICAIGGPTSHIAIIARSHGIPAVLGAGEAVSVWRHAKVLALDGKTGEVVADPTPEAIAEFEQRRAKNIAQQNEFDVFRHVTPRLASGQVIEVAANIGTLQEAETAKTAGAMGIGLFRTELLFMQQRGLPSEDVQTEIYAKVASLMTPFPVIIRTLDVGGDKPVAGIDFPHEENPFLGWRGIRMCLDRPDVFKPQLRALLRASVQGNIKVMIPMVVDAGEVRKTRTLINECIGELENEGKAYKNFELGVMVETPAAVLVAEDLAREVAFFSIGTNDLTQYVMAADRLNRSVAALNDVTHPAVMAAIRLVGEAGAKAGIPVGMCGEAAGRTDLVATFIAMGITEFSMSASRIAAVKHAISQIT